MASGTVSILPGDAHLRGGEGTAAAGTRSRGVGAPWSESARAEDSCVEGSGLTGGHSCGWSDENGLSERGAAADGFGRSGSGPASAVPDGDADRKRRLAPRGRTLRPRASRRHLSELGDASGLLDQFLGAGEVAARRCLTGEPGAGFKERGDRGGERPSRGGTWRLAPVVRSRLGRCPWGAGGARTRSRRNEAAAPSVSREVLRASMVGATGLEPATSCTPSAPTPSVNFGRVWQLLARRGDSGLGTIDAFARIRRFSLESKCTRNARKYHGECGSAADRQGGGRAAARLRGHRVRAVRSRRARARQDLDVRHPDRGGAPLPVHPATQSLKGGGQKLPRNRTRCGGWHKWWLVGCSAPPAC